MAQIVVMKYEDRLPQRKIANVLQQRYALDLTPATVLDVLRRAADRLTPAYERIKEEIRQTPVVNADETGAKINGKKHWFSVFLSTLNVLFVLRKRRDHKTVEEVLGKDFSGILGCDGLKAYRMVVRCIQRCWAHLLREAQFLAQKHEGQARVLYNSLCELFSKVKKITIETEASVREETYAFCIKQMRIFLSIAKAYRELRKFAVTLKNGLEQWFTCVLHPEVEPTNNRAERELREFVVQRKIFPTFRSEKGPRNTEILMSVLATWRLRELNTLSMLRASLSS